MKRLLAMVVLLGAPAPKTGWNPPAVRIQQSGALKGYASTINCTTGMTCNVAGSSATFSAAGGGGGGSPGGASGNLQKNDGAGGFGAYTGTTCSYAVKSAR